MEYRIIDKKTMKICIALIKNATTNIQNII